MRLPVLLVALIASTSCVMRTGYPAIEDRRVTSLLGIETELVDAAGRIVVAGELLSADSSAYVLMARARVMVVPVVPNLGGLLTGTGQFVRLRLGVRTLWAATEMNVVKSHSRFPYGIPQPAMAALLANTGQTAPDTVRLAQP